MGDATRRPDRAAARRALAAMLDAAATGQFPPADGEVTFLPQPSARDAGVIGFTGHAVVFADADHSWLADLLPDDDLSAPLSPAFLVALASTTGRAVHNIDMLTCADPLPGLPTLKLRAEARRAHPRIARALRYRDDVSAWRTDGGVLLLGRGVARRWEVAIEVDPACRDRGLGAQLAMAARHLVPGGAPLWAQIAPGNAASVRAFLAAGFRPIGAEALLALDRAGPPGCRSEPA
ncbi:MAG: GNAT family N-acetyltransferase [Streptosporangiaceae bacterium]